MRKHVFAVEKYCKQHLEGRLPAKQDISKILESALSEDTSSSLRYHRAKQCQSGKRKHDNPFKPQLEKYGIQFPDKQDKCSTTPCDESRDNSHSISSIMATAPESESQENEQLAMVIRESLRHVPRVSTSPNSAQSVLLIGGHEKPGLELESYQVPAFPMHMTTSMYPNLPYMQHYFPRVETTGLCLPQFPVNIALPMPLPLKENVETKTKDNVNSDEDTSVENDTAAILVSMRGNCQGDQADGPLDNLLGL